MRLTYMDRATYRQKADAQVIERLRAEFGDFYLVPEGGSNALALRGCRELVDEISVDFDVICCPCGTGGTLAGIASGLRGPQHALGFSVLKGGSFLNDDVASLQVDALGTTTENWSIEQDFHFGGYAKRTDDLRDFMSDFERRHGIALEWIYVAKMMYGLFTLIDAGQFDDGAVIVAVITG